MKSLELLLNHNSSVVSQNTLASKNSVFPVNIVVSGFVVSVTHLSSQQSKHTT